MLFIYRTSILSFTESLRFFPFPSSIIIIQGDGQTKILFAELKQVGQNFQLSYSKSS